MFQGNYDTDSVVTNFLNPSIMEAIAVRINPTVAHNAKSMRFELLGCDRTSKIHP